MADVFRAAQRGNVNTVRAHVNRGMNVNSRRRGGWTLLHDAAAHGRAPLVRYLISKGANVNDNHNPRHITPLMSAAMGDHVVVCLILIREGATVNARSLNNKTALSLAVQRGFRNTAEYLLGQGANVNQNTARLLANLPVRNNNSNEPRTNNNVPNNRASSNSNSNNAPRLANVHLPIERVNKLPNNLTNALSLRRWKKGDTAIRHKVGTHEWFFRPTWFNRHVKGNSWKTLPESSIIVVGKNPITRQNMLRRNLRKVKFV